MEQQLGSFARGVDGVAELLPLLAMGFTESKAMLNEQSTNARGTN